MSDIQEQIILAHKKTEENDIKLLQEKINKAIEYIKNNQWELKENGYEDDLKIESKPILDILKGDNK